MLARISLLILLFSIISATGSLIAERYDDSILLSINPLQLAAELESEGRIEEVLHLARFSQQYLPPDHEFSSAAIEDKASQTLDSSLYLVERFVAGALTGEASDAPGLLGTLALDMLVIGDIRDLLVQGYKEFDNGQGDEVIMGFSAAGLLLTVAPEISWAPSMFKTLWRGKRFSEPLQKQIRYKLSQAGKTGDYRSLQRMVRHSAEAIDSMGAGPAMVVFRQVNTSNELALLATKAKIAPVETYTLASINGIKSLESISTTGSKQGKLLKHVKLATRQHKFFGKALALVPMIWLVMAFCFSVTVFGIILFQPGMRRA